MSVTCTWALTATVAETLETNVGGLGTGNRTLTYTDYNEGSQLTATTTPPVTKAAHFLLTLTAGAATVDLTALTGTNGATVTGVGLRVQILRVKNLGANALTIVPGASNGIDLLGAASSLTVPPGGAFEIFLNDAGPDIATTDRTLDVTGTGTQTSEWTVVMG